MVFAPEVSEDIDPAATTALAVVRKPYTALDFIADQLRAANPSGDWDSNGTDRSRELGAILLRNGIIELSKLAAVKLTVTTREFPWADPADQIQIALEYDGRRLGYLGTPDEPANDPWLQNYTRLAWSSVGHGHVSYMCQFSPQGFTIGPQWGSSSDWGTFREVVRFFVTVWLMYLSMGTASGSGAGVGSAIMGASFAASYPVLTAILGNIAIGAYFSGGDVKGAVKGALINYVAGSLGDAARSVAYTVTQIEILGVLAESAVRALAAGRDVEKAVTMSLLQYGFGSVAEFMASTESPVMNDASAFEVVDVSQYPMDGDPFGPQGLPTTENSNAYDTGYGWDSNFTAVSAQDIGPVSQGFVPFTMGSELAPVTFDPGAPAASFQVGTVTADGLRVEAPVRAVTDSGSVTGVVNTLTGAALAALKLTQAWNQAKNPAPVAQARVVSPQAVQSVSDAGVIITRGANGTVTAARPPVGEARSTTGGNVVVNNGDGTYTLITPSGERRAISYGANTGTDPAAVPWSLLIGGAGLLLSILK